MTDSFETNKSPLAPTRWVSSLGTGKKKASGADGLEKPEEESDSDENDRAGLDESEEPYGDDRRERPNLRRWKRPEMSEELWVRPSSPSLSVLLPLEMRFLRSAADQCAAWRTWRGA